MTAEVVCPCTRRARNAPFPVARALVPQADAVNACLGWTTDVAGNQSWWQALPMSTSLPRNVANTLVRIWGPNPPPLSDRGSEVVESLKGRYQLQLPPDFEEYIRQHAPAEDSSDPRHFIWWAPQNIKSLTEECGSTTSSDQVNREIECEADQYLVFADFLAWCYAYAICCSQGPNKGKIALIGGRPDGFVASSFSHFVALAADDSQLLHVP